MLARAHRSHISLRSRCTAMLAGLRTLIQTGQGPDRYVPSTRLETMPSAPSRQACAKTAAPSSLVYSLSRMPPSTLRKSRASAALRSRNARLRKSSPSCSSSRRRRGSWSGALPTGQLLELQQAVRSKRNQAPGFDLLGSSRDRRQSRSPVIPIAAMTTSHSR